MITSGPEHATIAIVGEAPGWDEVQQKRPFVGASGMELTRMLGEVGIMRDQCYITNVTHTRPPGNDISNFFYKAGVAQKARRPRVKGRYPNDSIIEDIPILESQLRKMQPNLIIALGNTALWALTGEQGITKWRGSIMEFEGIKLIPTFHPAGVMRNWPWRWLVIQDLRRAAHEATFPEIRYPARNYIVRPSFEAVMDFLSSIRDQVVVGDIETRGGHIACYGLATSKLDAISIPFMCIERSKGYWSLEEEVAITLKLKEVTTRKDVGMVFHFAGYDMQYIAKEWGYVPHLTDDTMVMQHAAFPNLRKALDFISSLYCEYYRYWKDDGKEWDPRMPEDQLWSYNCDDCCYTFEDYESLRGTIATLGQEEQYRFLMELQLPVLRMMLRGLNVNKVYKDGIAAELEESWDSRIAWFSEVLDHPLNPRSHKQLTALFYQDFQMKAIKDRKTGSLTVNDAALKLISRREPGLRQLCEAILECRSIGIFKKNFAEAPLGPDDRMRGSISLTGAKTYRFSTSADSFGGGCNLQTISKGTEED